MSRSHSGASSASDVYSESSPSFFRLLLTKKCSFFSASSMTLSSSLLDMGETLPHRDRCCRGRFRGRNRLREALPERVHLSFLVAAHPAIRRRIGPVEHCSRDGAASPTLVVHVARPNAWAFLVRAVAPAPGGHPVAWDRRAARALPVRSEEHTSELQS